MAGDPTGPAALIARLAAAAAEPLVASGVCTPGDVNVNVSMNVNVNVDVSVSPLWRAACAHLGRWM